MRLYERGFLPGWDPVFDVRPIYTTNGLYKGWAKECDEDGWAKYAKCGDSMSIGPSLARQVYAKHTLVEIRENARWIKIERWSE